MPYGLTRCAAAALLAVLLSGCVGIQIHPTARERAISLRAGDLEAAGVAFITPSTATGQEEEKQAVALIFAEALKRERPGVKVVALSETLGAINRNGLADAYKRMYNDYRDTGLFERAILGQVGAATGSRYLAQLKLQRFSQGTRERFGVLGLRLIDTQFASVRLFFQIWDTRDGTIAWEGMQEMLHAEDKFAEQPVTLQTMIDRAATDLVARLP